MSLIRNLLALIGLVSVVVIALATVELKDKLQGFDEGAAQVYMDLGTKLLETKNSAEATVLKIPVEEGVSVEDVEEAMLAVAIEHSISNVGILPLSEDIAAKTGKPHRYVKIFMFCRSTTAGQMLEYSDAFSAYLPCRVTLIEDKQGKLWLYSMDMDMMIYGGEALAPELKKAALGVQNTIKDIMTRGAEGDF